MRQLDKEENAKRIALILSKNKASVKDVSEILDMIEKVLTVWTQPRGYRFGTCSPTNKTFDSNRIGNE